MDSSENGVVTQTPEGGAIVATAGADPLTSTQRLTFLSLLIPWVAQLVLTWLRPDILHMFLQTPSGYAAITGCAALTGVQAWLLKKAYRRINRANRTGGGHSTSVLIIFATALLGALELLVVFLAPVAWAFLVAPQAR